ncbi:MAG: glycosyltransferase family 39 protein [Bacteroidetes bacterium]|nr:glycosyltransferase family 39 protein [Bacteroidota bacterium]
MFFFLLYGNPQGFYLDDSSQYWYLAKNLAESGIYSFSAEEPFWLNTTRTPLYPLFIAGFMSVGLGTATVVLLQLLLSSLTVVLVAYLLFKISGGLAAAIIAGFVLALDIYSISFANFLMAETLFTFLLTASIALLVSYKDFKRPVRAFVYSAVLMGLAILCKPIVLYLPLLLGLAIILISYKNFKTNLLHAGVFLVVCLLVIAPWFIRNNVVTGKFYFTTLGSQNLYLYRATDVYSRVNNLPFAEAQNILLKEAIDSFPGDHEDQPIEFNIYMRKQALDIIKAHPLTYLRNKTKYAAFLMFKPSASYLEVQMKSRFKYYPILYPDLSDIQEIWRFKLQNWDRTTLALVLYQFLMLILIWFGFIFGIIYLLRTKKYFLLVIVLLTIGYFLVIAGGPEADARIRMPFMPIIVLMSSLGAAYLLKLRRSSKKPG